MSELLQHKIRQELKKLLRPKDEGWEGITGDGAGTVEVPGQPDYWYVRRSAGGLPLVVRRGSAPKLEGVRVWVGPDPFMRRITRILGVVTENGVVQSVGRHANTHYEDSTDPVYITDRQITPLLSYATTAMTVHVNAGYLVYNGKSFKLNSTDIDLTGYIPGYDGGAVYDLIRVNSAGVISVQEGVVVDSFLELTDDDIPTVESGYAPLAFVRLYDGQTALSRLTANPDVKPVIWGAGLWPLYVSEVDGNPKIPVHEIIFSNDSVTDNADGTASVNLSTAAGIDSFTSAYGSPPASPTEGDLWMPNNSCVVLRYSGTAWVPWGPIFPLATPPTTGWSWDNQDTATVDTTNGGIYMSTPGNAATELYCYYRTAPSVPYKITALVIGNCVPANYVYFGLTFRQSSDGKLATFAVTHESSWIWRVQKWTNSTTFSAHYTSVDTRSLVPYYFLRIEDDNTNRICSFSFDGINFRLIYSVGRTDFLTADQVGLVLKSQSGTNGVGMNVISWLES
jgi:hypothetical protein